MNKKEMDYREYLITKKGYLGHRLAELYKEMLEIDIKLEENFICPQCFNQLEEENFADIVVVGCTKCDYENTHR